MTILNDYYASGTNTVRLFTLELTCSAWTAPILICNGFTDRTCVTEDSRTLTFIAAAIDVALPKKDSRGAQNITIAIDNVNGEAQAKIDEAMTAEARVSATLRTYLLSDLTAPAEAPYRMTVQDGSIEQLAVQLRAGFFDLINVAWPRLLYTTQNAPGLKYL